MSQHSLTYPNGSRLGVFSLKTYTVFNFITSAYHLHWHCQTVMLYTSKDHRNHFVVAGIMDLNGDFLLQVMSTSALILFRFERYILTSTTHHNISLTRQRLIYYVSWHPKRLKLKKNHKKYWRFSSCIQGLNTDSNCPLRTNLYEICWPCQLACFHPDFVLYTLR